jgi:hypothetical protein
MDLSSHGADTLDPLTTGPIFKRLIDRGRNAFALGFLTRQLQQVIAQGDGRPHKSSLNLHQNTTFIASIIQYFGE